ncbi:hypothetical protein BGZ63DRAFT_153051 [Mariannaea sp. PMI_226]|nr:hypothetical protein BGZ63DRAFT_153051 [Mariannaea sp. PMI_226]
MPFVLTTLFILYWSYGDPKRAQNGACRNRDSSPSPESCLSKKGFIYHVRSCAECNFYNAYAATHALCPGEAGCKIGVHDLAFLYLIQSTSKHTGESSALQYCWVSNLQKARTPLLYFGTFLLRTFQCSNVRCCGA